jgi:lipopolysaccharide transport protein LptA
MKTTRFLSGILLSIALAITATGAPAESPSPAKAKAKATAAKPDESASPAKSKAKPATAKPDKEASPGNKLFGGDAGNSTEPITTEIYSDQAFFDSAKSTGVFTGHVKVTDPRFNLQSDKLTVYITKGEDQGLERAVAEGNVALVRDRPDANGGPPTRAAGRSEKAVYLAKTGDVELTGSPRVQQGMNTHIATSPDTVMVINQNGQLTTHGPSRTDIRQEPKNDEDGTGTGDKTGEKTGDKSGGGKGKKKDGENASPKPAASPVKK